ncbi:MAG TPA: ABC transporter permease [Gemmatimonadaceae bacterium]|nr:ABC transporter permease [Gemmatimonadaceae bacterium]
MHSVGQDIRFAMRSARRFRAFTATALGTLAIGIGAATATFSVANGIVLRPLPVREQDRIVVMWARQRDFAHVPVRWAEIERFGRESRAFERVGGIDYNGAWTWAMSDAGQPAPIKGTWVTGDLFHVLGVVPQVGRMIERSDDVASAPLVAVISDGLWRRRYGADSGVVGRLLDYEGKRFTIVGVAPRGFEYPEGVELWSALVPFAPDVRADTATGSFDMVARLRTDATMEQGRRELDGFLDRAYARWRNTVGQFHATARTLPTLIVGDVRPVVLILSAAACLVLVIACVNVANLLLVRGVTRTRELAIRASLGAARGRIVRQLMTEAVLLGLSGCALGVGLATLGVRVLVALAPPGVPRLLETGVDAWSMVFASAAALASVVVFGLGPALALTRADVGVLARQSGSRSTTGSRPSTRAKQLLVVVQAAVAVLVLTAAGLLGRSLANLQHVELGFERDRIVIAQLAMPWSKFASADGGDRFTLMLDRLKEATRALPGVASVAVTASPPYSGTGGWDALPNVEGVSDTERARLPWVNMEIVTSEYFETLGVALVQGRLLAASDRKGTVPVAVVNEAMARRYWPAESAIGKRFRLGAPSDTTRPTHTVVGVVADMRYRQLETAMPSFYVPNVQRDGGAPTYFIIRTTSSPALLLPSLRHAFALVDADASVLSARTMNDYLAGPLARPRFSSVLLAVFAGVALLLVAVGIYGVIAEYGRQRRRELGIRLALGAQPASLLRMMLRTGLWPAVLGTAIGIAVALAGARVVQSQLYDVAPTDPMTFIGVAILIITVAVIACAGPARVAARSNPGDILRAE